MQRSFDPAKLVFIDETSAATNMARRYGRAVPTNSTALEAFRYYVTTLWRRSLRRRSQKAALTWARNGKAAEDWLPRPRVLHPWPSDRFAVKHPRWEPYA